MNERRRDREIGERMEKDIKEKNNLEMSVLSGRVWRGDYGVESEKRGIEDGGKEEGEIMLDCGEGIKIVSLSCALGKMDI